MKWPYDFQENEPCLLTPYQTIGLKLRLRTVGKIKPIFSKLFGKHVLATALHIYEMRSWTQQFYSLN